MGLYLTIESSDQVQAGLCIHHFIVIHKLSTFCTEYIYIFATITMSTQYDVVTDKEMVFTKGWLCSASDHLCHSRRSEL